jgi:aspartyl-tRNA(Asn)/glutamyl-tRNA(Gln) amidotransferase subunit A
MIPRSLDEIQHLLREGEITVEGLVKEYLHNIDSSSHLNIYIEVYEEHALELAKIIDKRIQENPQSLGKLFGAVISIKDVLCLEGQEVTAASKMLQGFTSQFTSHALSCALQEDAIIIGRTNCDEFAMGSTNEHSTYGTTLNGLDPTRVPGGSSGGAAVSVQQNTCLIALGSDTGGSVRQPSAFCGVFGFKPSYGRISRNGLIAYASSFDQIGIIAHGTKDIATILSVISGKDPLDSTSLDIPATRNNLSPKSDPLRIAYFHEIFKDDLLSEDVTDAFDRAIKSLESQGNSVEPVNFDLLDYLVPAYYVLTTAEASSNLLRYDGIRYGNREENPVDLEDLYCSSRTAGFGREVKRRIMMGTFVLSIGYYDAYFNKAQKVRRMISDRISEIFRDFDLIMIPTVTDPAWPVNSIQDDPVKMYLSDIFTVLANLCGTPALSVPVQSKSSNLSVGIQYMAPALEDERLLRFSYHFLEMA